MELPRKAPYRIRLLFLHFPCFFLVFYDKDQYVTDLVKGFEKLLYDQVDILRKKFPSSTYAKAHNRYDIFAPGRFEEGLNSFISPPSF